MLNPARGELKPKHLGPRMSNVVSGRRLPSMPPLSCDAAMKIQQLSARPKRTREPERWLAPATNSAGNAGDLWPECLE